MGKNAEYMILGYSLLAVLLGGMIAWIYLRYRALFHEEALLDEYEAEERGDHVASAVGALEEDVLPGETSAGMTDMASPSEAIVHSLPKER